MLLLFLCTAALGGCGNDETEERKITGHKEYVLTVASEKRLGMAPSGGSLLTQVYAVRKESSAQWESLAAIAGFDYEPGYEYEIRVSETSYLDYRMGDPAWTEHELLEVISKEEKSSCGVPLNFIPGWYYEQSCVCLNAEFRHAVDADREEEIADDLESGSALSPEGLRRYIAPGFKHWFLLDAEKNVAAQGVLRSERKEYGEFPEACRRLLPPEGEVLEYMQWDFLRDAGAEGDAERYDVLVGRRAGSRSPARESVRLWLYKDLTDYYRDKYPEAGVRAVVICHKADI